MSDQPSEPVNYTRPPKKAEEKLRVLFTDPQRLEIGRKLAEAHAELEASVEDRKSTSATLKAKETAILAKISEYSLNLNQGFALKETPVLVTYDCPAVGQKTITRLDTAEQVRIEAMTLVEMQGELPMETPEAIKVSSDGVVAVDADEDDDDQDKTEDFFAPKN